MSGGTASVSSRKGPSCISRAPIPSLAGASRPSPTHDCCITEDLPQRGHPRQLRPELLAVHGMFTGRSDKMRDFQSGTVPRHRESERNASSGRGRRPGRSRSQRECAQHMGEGKGSLEERRKGLYMTMKRTAGNGDNILLCFGPRCCEDFSRRGPCHLHAHYKLTPVKVITFT